MKKFVFTTALLFFIAFTGCKKSNTYFIDDTDPELKGVMTVFRDCSGDFLLFENKLYDVCNYKTISKFESGTKLMAGINKSCERHQYPPREICLIGHSNAGGTVTVVSLEPVN